MFARKAEGVGGDHDVEDVDGIEDVEDGDGVEDAKDGDGVKGIVEGVKGVEGLKMGVEGVEGVEAMEGGVGVLALSPDLDEAVICELSWARCEPTCTPDVSWRCGDPSISKTAS